MPGIHPTGVIGDRPAQRLSEAQADVSTCTPLLPTMRAGVAAAAAADAAMVSSDKPGSFQQLRLACRSRFIAPRMFRKRIDGEC